MKADCVKALIESAACHAVYGAKIHGDLVLEGMTFPDGLAFEDCLITGSLVLRNAELAKELKLTRTTITGDLRIEDVRARGGMSLQNVEIGGDFYLSGQIMERYFTENITIGGDVTLMNLVLPTTISDGGFRISGSTAVTNVVRQS